MYPTGPSYKLNWGEANPKSFPFSRIRSNVTIEDEIFKEQMLNLYQQHRFLKFCDQIFFETNLPLFLNS